jgi:hypothetical protein
MRSLILALAILTAHIGTAHAWGDTGHRVVCEIAFRLAAPEARAEIRRLMQLDTGFDFYRDSCIWPDHPKKRAEEHFINVARNANGIGPNEQCPTANVCLLSAIEDDMSVLSSPGTSDEDKLKSLKFLGHWIGDLHQPLHVSFESDRGGNDIRVSGLCRTNMHSAWDTCMLQLAIGSDVTGAATDLLNSFDAAIREEWTTGDTKDWANESFDVALAANTRYCVQSGSTCDVPEGSVALDEEYVRVNTPILREQVAKAGVRLAHMLEKAFQ